MKESEMDKCTSWIDISFAKLNATIDSWHYNNILLDVLLKAPFSPARATATTSNPVFTHSFFCAAAAGETAQGPAEGRRSHQHDFEDAICP